jgi:replicative DNA helicase
LLTRLGEECFNLASGDGDVEQFRSLSDEVKSSFTDVDEAGLDRNIINKDLEGLFETTMKTPGLRWRLNSLNKSLGSLRKGNFMFVFARPESGKTTFLASEITHMVTQVDKPILWFNNEEQGEVVLTRCYQAALGLTIHDLMKDREENERRFNEITGGNIKIYDSASIHRRDVERVCKTFEPSLVVFDQIDKLQGFVGDREDLRLGNIYQWARELAKGFAPVIGITQADGGAEGKKWLNMADVMNAKTGKQSEADAILGIGKVDDPQLEFIRFLSISKNKLFGDSDTLPELRHGRIEVLIQPEVARYKDLI